MKYLKSFNEKISYDELVNLIDDLEDFKYELNDCGIDMVVYPHYELYPIDLNMLRLYLQGSITEKKDFYIILTGETEESDVIEDVINRIKLVVKEFGLKTDVEKSVYKGRIVNNRIYEIFINILK